MGISDTLAVGLQRSRNVLWQATLCHSTLRDADMHRADLSQADMQGAHYTEEQLATAYASWSTTR